MKIFYTSQAYTLFHIRINPETFDQSVIRQIVHSFYEYPTVSGLLDKVKDWYGFPVISLHNKLINHLATVNKLVWSSHTHLPALEGVGYARLTLHHNGISSWDVIFIIYLCVVRR